MMFRIGVKRLLKYFDSTRNVKLDVVFDWTYSNNILYVFIKHLGRDYVFFEEYVSFDDVPINVRIFLSAEFQLEGVLSEDSFYPAPEVINEAPPTDYVNELSKVSF